jgi:hypothetical protein
MGNVGSGVLIVERTVAVLSVLSTMAIEIVHVQHS